MGSNQRLIQFEDADGTAQEARLLSFIKEVPTSEELKVKRKFQNKEYKVRNVRYAILTNAFLRNKELCEALERRQIIIQTGGLPASQARSDMLQCLIDNLSPILTWINSTPLLLHNLLDNVAVLN